MDNDQTTSHTGRRTTAGHAGTRRRPTTPDDLIAADGFISDDTMAGSNNDSDPEPADDLIESDAPVLGNTPRKKPGIQAPKGQVRRYAAGDYPWLGGGGAPRKLASSQVAPLVALARGNEILTLGNIKEVSNRLTLPDFRTAQGKALKAAMSNGDVLVMPWYSAGALTTGAIERPTAIQYRPEVPATDDDGRERKYEFVSGAHSPLGIHPATPPSWAKDRSRPVLIAEGQLKADSALTAALLARGVDFNELLARHSETPPQAKDRLASILDTMAADDMPLVTEIAGVYNWRSCISDIGRLRLEGRTVWLGIDGDVATNMSVFQGAKGLWDLMESREAIPMMLVPVAERGGEDLKLGIDDFLAADGTWDDLLAMLEPTMPEPEMSDDWDRVGEIRCSDDMTHLVECEEIKAGGVVKGVTWRPTGLRMGGRVVATSMTRYPAPHEIADGAYDELFALRDDAEADEAVELEVAWMDDMEPDVRHTARVTGPNTILNYLPEKWADKGANIPFDLLSHDQWPPTAEEGRQFLAAVKNHKRHEVARRTRWRRNGWVPVPGFDIPAFVIGDQVVCDMEQRPSIFSDVSPGTLRQIEQFGVGELTTRKFTDARYRTKLVADIEAMVDAFILSDAWSSRGQALIFTAAGLRPALPVPTKVTLFVAGRPGQGKSWSAAATQAFWGRRNGSFTTTRLPGAVTDSEAATENARSQTVCWTVDDFAPSANPTQAARQTALVEGLIRSQFNGKGTSKMTREGRPRHARDPHGILLITAENRVATKSILQRTLVLSINKGALGSRAATDKVVGLYTDDCVPARVTQGLIKFLREKVAVEKGWPGMYAEMDGRRTGLMNRILEKWATASTDKGLQRRYAEMLADLFLSFEYLRALMRELGMAEKYVKAFGGAAMQTAADVVLDGLREQEENSLSKSLLTAIRQSLSSGFGHLVSSVDPSMPPGTDKALQQALGWGAFRGGDMSARGIPIGHFMHNPESPTDEPYVILNPTLSFQVAQKYFAADIGGFGVTRMAAWSAFYEDNMHHPGIKRRPRNGKASFSEVRISRTDLRVSGVAVRLADLLSDGNSTTDWEELVSKKDSSDV